MRRRGEKTRTVANDDDALSLANDDLDITLSGTQRYVTLFRDTAVKLPVKRIIVGPADGADDRIRALSRRLQ